MATDQAAHLALFLGRFHPIVLHAPIGLLIGLAVLETHALATRSQAPARRPLAWMMAASAVVAAGLGWLLANEGGYDATLLAYHRWLSIAFAALCVVVAILGQCIAADRRWSIPAFRTALVAAVLLMPISTHFGGSLTRGVGYLTRYAPTWLGGPPPKAAKPLPKAVEPPARPPTAPVSFTRQIVPVINERCASCHGEKKQRGKLRLDSPAAIAAGGKNGPVVVAGQPENSPLYLRVVLPGDDDDRMPADGDPLSSDQVELIRRWIGAGARTDD